MTVLNTDQAIAKFNLGSASNAELAAGKGTKDDHEKIMFSLVPPEFTRALARLFTVGARKYTKNNWMNNMDRSRFADALERHLNAYKCGEIYDVQTGTHHLIAVAWNACALFTYDIRGIGATAVAECQPPQPEYKEPAFVAYSERAA